MRKPRHVWLFSIAIPCLLMMGFGMILKPPSSKSQDCPLPTRNEKGEMVVVVGEKDQKVTLVRGEILVVKLPARLGTGYGWQVGKNNKSHLEIDGEPKTEEIPKDESQKLKLGGAQYQVFRFLPRATGKVELELNYRRPFAEGSPPRKTYKLEVTVSDSRS